MKEILNFIKFRMLNLNLWYNLWSDVYIMHRMYYPVGLHNVLLIKALIYCIFIFCFDFILSIKDNIYYFWIQNKIFRKIWWISGHTQLSLRRHYSNLQKYLKYQKNLFKKYLFLIWEIEEYIIGIQEIEYYKVKNNKKKILDIEENWEKIVYYFKYFNRYNNNKCEEIIRSWMNFFQEEGIWKEVYIKQQEILNNIKKEWEKNANDK